MKTTKTKYVLVILVNYILVLCVCLFYRYGDIAQYFWLIFIVMQIVLIILNHMITYNKAALLFLHGNLLISTIIANGLFTYLHYTVISSDDETLIVGTMGLVYGAIFVLILSLISLLIRVFVKRKSTN